MTTEQTFSKCLSDKALEARFTLVFALEHKDKLLFELGPEIRKVYMEMFGDAEQKVIEAELNASICKELLDKIQAAVNRREPVDLNALKAEMEEKKKQKLSELEKSDTANVEKKTLSPVDKKEFDLKYKKLLNRLHPALNPDQTEDDKELYEKLLTAYKCNDLEALRVIDEICKKAEEMELSEKSGARLKDVDIEIRQSLKIDDSDSDSDRVFAHSDYDLAIDIARYFNLYITDYELINEANEYLKKAEQIKEEIDGLMKSFPLSAMDMLKSEEKRKEYADELNYRYRSATEDIQYYTRRINEAVGGLPNA